MSAISDTPGFSQSVAAANFGYAIAQPSLTRKPPVTTLLSEDRELGTSDRKKAIARSREITRDFSIVSWALRKHVDYVARFTFQSQTGDPALDRKIEKIIGHAAKRGHFDITGRYSLDEFLRIAEACRTIDGDLGIVKLESGHVQAIESDRIRNPLGVLENDPEWAHGVKLSEWGAPLGYAVHRRSRNGNYEFERFVDAKNMLLHGYFGRFDQVRGIGLLVTAANTYKDVYDSFDYALAKAKMLQMFGLKFKRSANAAALGVSAEDGGEASEQRRLALRGKASYMIDLEPDEDLNPIQDTQPSDQFQSYTKLMIMVALKSLDIYYSMFDESHTNFFGSRAGIVQYIESCKPKRAGNQYLLEDWTRWRLALEILNENLTLPVGMTLDDLCFEWVPAGLPWWKADEEAKGLLTTVTAGFDSYTGVCGQLGRDFKDILAQRKKDEEYADSLGINLPTMTAQVNLNINN